MCGIAGIISENTLNITEQRLLQMTRSLQHRGPDKEHIWISEDKVVGLGHRRLCIIDLSDAASQPLHYLNRYTIVYNGEIYNYIEIRETLKKQGYVFQSQSDTEVITAAYDYWKQDCLQQFDGMFAFAIWDEKEKQLFATRDRFGEKPFYYHFNETANTLVFASEMKALWAGGVDKQVNNSMLLNYLALGWVQNPSNAAETFYNNILQLPPASYLLYAVNKRTFSINNYWDIDKKTCTNISEEKAVEQFCELFETSVKRRLRSDVSLGTSLSGGLDSSSVVAVIKKILSENAQLTTFSAIFPGFEKDESVYIDIVKKQFNINNYTVVPTADSFIKDFETLCHYQEEPFGSASIYAQYKVFELAKQHGVTVLLDGQGADETLAGYNKYIHWFLQEMLFQKFSVFKQQKALLQKNNIPFEWSWKNYIATLLPVQAAYQLQKKAKRQLFANNDITRDFAQSHFNESAFYKPIITGLNDILYFNTMQSGLQELLRYADRNSMAHGREVRLPFLNYQLVEFIFSLPSTFKIKDGFTKNILRKAMQHRLPASIVFRKDKVGYEPPQKTWMEDNRVQAFIQSSKETLVNENILNKKVLEKPVQAKGSIEGGNSDFYYLVAGQLLK